MATDGVLTVAALGKPKVGDCDKLFTELGTAFRWDEKVTAAFKATKADSLNEFRALFGRDKAAAHAAISEFVAKIPDLENRMVMTARVNLAWEATLDASNSQESAAMKRQLLGDDHEALLPIEDRRSMRDMFWARYKLRFLAHIDASDYLVSSVRKQIDSRTLCLQVIMKVKSLAHQMKAERKRTRLTHPSGGDQMLELVEREHEAQLDETEDVATYLDKLETYAIALARAGCMVIEPAPVSTETFDAESVHYVQCPLDITMKYHARAKSFAKASGCSLSVLQARDEAERQLWVEKFRETNFSLGKIILDVYVQRQGCWIHEPAKLKREPSDTGSRGSGAAAPVVPPAQVEQGKRTGWARKLMNGELLCQEWNDGGCSKPCPRNEKHACCHIVKSNGRACGMSNHRARDCKKA